MSGSKLRKTATGLAFLSPNILGFLAFTLVPLLVSFAMAFTNWDVHMHNMFQDEPVRFVGLENFFRLFEERHFLQYFGNTLFFMLGMPFGIAGSLAAALLLSKKLRPGRRTLLVRAVCTAVLIAGLLMLVAAGCGGTATVVLLAGIAGTILIAGRTGGQSVYRTVFYSPHFTAGVATFLLWKKLYNPHNGPINLALAPVLDRVAAATNALPAAGVQAGSYVCAAVLALLLIWTVIRIGRAWRDGDAGWLSVVLAAALLTAPVVMACFWSSSRVFVLVAITAGTIAVVLLAIRLVPRRDFTCRFDYGMSSTVIFAAGIMVIGFVMIGLGNVLHQLPAMSADGLEPPQWLSNYHWAKPSLMMMGLWAAVGSNNMLLYLAGLSNIPPELYEAADIDGASGPQRFWHITWPQLAPITFFIFVMSVIGGLQGGFEMARTMTGGGPAGATTTLSYYIYSEGFQAGRLGYASAVAWALFLLVAVVTLFNWKFGNRRIND